jgi:hypothetical protein
MNPPPLQPTIALPAQLSRFQPLPRILCVDDFDHGLNGWIDLHTNHVEPGFNARRSVFDKTRVPPLSLSTASFGWAGTHGSVDGLYSLKVATRPVANRYEAMPAPGSVACAIKRLTLLPGVSQYQYEAWFSYTAEQDRPGVGEQDVRAIFFIIDIQDHEYRYMPCLRYVNSVNGRLVKCWQYAKSTAAGDQDWTYGAGAEWARNGVDPQWYGRRFPDGSTAGFQWVPDGAQELCYNESDDKLNWIHFRMVIDPVRREYVEMECQGVKFDLRSLQPTLVPKYAGITGLLNPFLGIENDAARRSCLYVDSFCLSAR